MLNIQETLNACINQHLGKPEQTAIPLIIKECAVAIAENYPSHRLAFASGKSVQGKLSFDFKLVQTADAEIITVKSDTYLLAVYDLEAFRLVYVRADGFLAYPDPTNPLQVKSVIGITQNKALKGEKCSVASSGLIVNPLWNFDPSLNKALLLDSNGLFSQRDATAQVEKFVGEVITKNSIMLYQFPKVE
jgi:hypothetical protein